MCGLASACGRISFDASTDASSDARSDGRGDARGDEIPDAPPGAMTLTFGERGNANVQGVTSDTFISNEAGEPTLNYGGTDELRSEQDVDERILIRFDVSAIAPTATVIGATLFVVVTEANVAATWELRPLLEPWAEGTFDGLPGAANYTQRMLATNWATAGASEPGSAGSVVATMQPTALGPISEELPAAVVQSWVTTPANNFGFIFYNTSTNTARMASSEYPTPDARPMLAVTFVP